MSVETTVKEMVARSLGVKLKEVTIKSTFIDDLGADSLDLVEIIMLLEEEFGMQILDEDAQKMKTVGDVVKYIEERIDADTIS